MLFCVVLSSPSQGAFKQSLEKYKKDSYFWMICWTQRCLLIVPLSEKSHDKVCGWGGGGELSQRMAGVEMVGGLL